MMKEPWSYQAQGIHVVLRPLPDLCWVIQTWQGVDALTPLPLRLFLEALQSVLGAEETLMIDDHRSASILQWLLNQGFTTARCKYLYERQLDEDLGFPDNALQWRNLADLGEAAFLAYLTQAASDDPEASAATQPEQEFAELLAHAGSAFDAQQWWVAFTDREQAVGVVLPQIFDDKPTEGTLSYIGVMPAFRQQGYGILLHRWGLASLAQRQVKRYIGSTGQTNTAMQRVFAHNACTLLARRYFLRPGQQLLS